MFFNPVGSVDMHIDTGTKVNKLASWFLDPSALLDSQ